MDEIWAGPRHEALSSPGGVLDGFTPSQLQCVTIHKRDANQGRLPESLVSGAFTGAQSHAALISDPWSPAPLEVGTNMAGSKGPIANHMGRLSSGQMPQTKSLLSGRTFLGPRDRLPAAEGKGQISLWVQSILHYTEESHSSLFLIPNLFNC